MAEQHTAVLKADSAEELAAAFLALRSGLRGFLRKRVNDSALVDDLTQEIFTKAWVAIATERAPGNLAGWLYVAARTTVADYYRSARLDMQVLDDDLPALETDDADIAYQELASCLQPLAQQLPPIYRDTLWALVFEGKPLRTLAAEQGVSLSAIKSRASRARARLKQKLLACCQVEFVNGVITDYRGHDAPACRCETV